MIDAGIITAIKRVVSSALPANEIVLFGSRATENASPDSDYDILILTPLKLTPREKLPLRTKIRKALLEYGLLSDILIQNQEEAQEKRALPGHIVRAALSEGITL